MSIILRKPANPSQSVQLATLLIAIHCSKLCNTQRKVLIGVRLPRINGTMVGAVHRFEHILFALFRSMNCLEAVFAVFSVVSGRDIKVFRADVRRYYLHIPETLLNLAQETHQLLAQNSSLRQPYRQAFTYQFREHKEFHFTAYFAMVAALCFLKKLQILVKHLLFRERYAIDTRHLRPFFITPPISTGDGHNLDSLDWSRI